MGAGLAVGEQKTAREQALALEQALLTANLGPCAPDRWSVQDIRVVLHDLPDSLEDDQGELRCGRRRSWLASAPIQEVDSLETHISSPSITDRQREHGCDIHTLQCGPWGRPRFGETVPTVALVHGWGDGLPMFAKLIPMLASRCRVLALDLPGMALSGRLTLPEGYQTTWQCKEVEDFFVDAIDQWVKATLADLSDSASTVDLYLVGHSFGGYLSMVYAMKHPRRVRMLFLLSPMLGFRELPAAFGPGGKYEHAAAIIDWAVEHRISPQGLVRQVPGMTQVAYSVVEHRYKTKKALEEDEVRLLSEYKVAIAEETDGDPSDPLFYACFGSMFKPKRRMELRWPRMGRCPCVFFYGDNDFVEADAAKDICKTLAPRQRPDVADRQSLASCRAEFVTVPDSGHSPQLDNPEFVAQEILWRIERDLRTQAMAPTPSAVRSPDASSFL